MKKKKKKRRSRILSERKKIAFNFDIAFCRQNLPWLQLELY